MKTIVLKSTNNQLFIEMKVDLFDNSEAFTIMTVEGLEDNEVIAGFSLRELPSSIGEMEIFATDKNLLMDIVDIDPAVATINQVSSVTALDITTTGTMTAGVANKAEVSDIICVADSSGSLDGTYFTMSSPTVDYYVWFDVDAGGNDPAPADKTAIQISIATDDANTVVGAAVEAAIDALDAFGASLSTATVTVTNAVEGSVTDAADVDSGVTPSVTTQGVDDTPYHQQVETEGGNGTLTFSLSSGALPAGLALSATGWISGVPTTVENPTFEITATDAFGQTDVEAGIDIDIA